jgi:hypothetical protein
MIAADFHNRVRKCIGRRGTKIRTSKVRDMVQSGGTDIFLAWDEMEDIPAMDHPEISFVDGSEGLRFYVERIKK